LDRLAARDAAGVPRVLELPRPEGKLAAMDLRLRATTFSETPLLG
jgi:hypothetical protein